jgi:hypothetical protein
MSDEGADSYGISEGLMRDVEPSPTLNYLRFHLNKGKMLNMGY